MTFRCLTLIIPTVWLCVSACSPYDPPMHGDHASERYKSDLDACRTSTSHAVYLQSAGDPGTWILSPITGPPKVRTGIRTCMHAKGYQLEQN